ncbi:DNA glycosylase [Clostridia bacterium]|nr:DNA glycosylase [Clostridia bacterium]
MIKKTFSNFSLAQIYESGQCFRFNRLDEYRFELIAMGKYLKLEQYPNSTECSFDCSETDFLQIWKEYFDLERNYELFANNPAATGYLKQAMNFGWGIRILKQDLWEMIISFIISQQNNIPRIKSCIETLCTNYGEKKQTKDGKTYFTFPSPKALSQVTEEQFRSLHFGYRSPYLVKTIQYILQGEPDVSTIKTLNYEEAKKSLLKLSGVGDKVADCICLFALHHFDAFPIDTHIRQILEQHYPAGFPFEQFSGYLGIIQQYLFYYHWKTK